jgi:hypothetical protein
MLEYLLNEDYKFQAKAIYKCLETASKSWNTDDLTKILKMTFNKVTLMSNLSKDKLAVQSSMAPSKILTLIEIVVPKKELS